MSLPKDEFKSTYYDYGYFADEKGKEFQRGGKTEYWGYKNPTGDFEGAKPIVQAWKTMFNPKNMLDVGAGRGQFVSMSRNVGIEAEGFDFSEFAVREGRYAKCKPEWLKSHDATKPWPYLNRSFDLVTALDLLEHIYLDDLSFVISELYRVSNNWIFLQIATVDGVKEKGYILKKGEPIPWQDGRTWAGHCTVMTEEFWYEKFEHDEWMPRRDMVNWFCSLVDKNIIRNWLLNSIIVLERI
jgi:hypothetical protein